MTFAGDLSPIEIMAAPAVRAAAEAGAAIVVLDRSLTSILYSNRSGRSTLGLPPENPARDLRQAALIPIVRQIHSAARSLQARGGARLLMRAASGGTSRAVVADLAEVARPGSDQPFVLLTVRGMTPPTAESVGADSLVDARLQERAAAVYAASRRIRSTPSFDALEIADLDQEVGAFHASAEDLQVVETGGHVATLARSAFGTIVVLIEEGPGLRVEETNAPLENTADRVPDGEAAGRPEPSGGFRSFSVKRPKLGQARGAISMSALLQRWHSRQEVDPVPVGSPTADATAPFIAGPVDAPSMAAEATQPAAMTAGPQPTKSPPLRSHWGQSSAAKAPGDVEAAIADPTVADHAPLAEPALGPSETAAVARTSRFGGLWRSAAPTQGEGPAEQAVGPADGVLGADADADEAATAGAEVDEMPGDEKDGQDARPILGPADPAHADADAAEIADASTDAEQDAAIQPKEAEAGDVSPAESPAGSLDAARPDATFVPRFDLSPVRFVWQIDRDGRFRVLSPDFAEAVGPRAADVVGRSFPEIAQVFGFDQSGEIARLLERRDTWSGRSILWPVESSDRKVPVDLAALPVYARDRSFDGFRGFGIVRMNESVPDEEQLGLILAGVGVPRQTADEADPAEPEAPFDIPETSEGSVETSDPSTFQFFEADAPAAPFGRRATPPPMLLAEIVETEDDGPKVIRLEERRRTKDASLSQAEEAAFRAIGMKLGTQSEAETPGALRFGDAPIEAAPGEGTGMRPLAEGDAVAATRPTVELAETSAVGDAASIAAAGEPLPSDGSTLDDEEARPAGDGFPEGLEALPGDEAATADADADDAAADKPLHPQADAVVAEADRSDDVTSVAAEFDVLFARLPLPVLVQVRERLVYANREFAELTGYGDIRTLYAAGGLEALFVDGPEEAPNVGELAIRRADGTVIDTRVHMQRVTLGGRSSLMMSFAPPDRDATPDTRPDAQSAGEVDDLRKQVEELQAVLDTATDGVVLLDTAGTIRAMNGSAHALFGIGQNDYSGRNLASLFAHESQKATLDYLEMLRDNGIGGILNDGREVIGRVAQGGFIPLFITIGRLSGDRGWCVVIRDIAHWKRIEEDLVNARRQAEAASLHKSRFLANISHELRTPLNAIIGFADVMASECFGPIGNERYIEYLGDIKRSGHHVLDLVNDLLDISKIEAGKLDLSFEAVSLNEVVSEVVSLMQPQANRERVIVRSNLPSSVPPVVADRRTMRQIALNLIANAIRFTPAGGQIIASTTYTAEGDVLLRFRDSGIGMTEREIEIALTPFQQVHAPTRGRGEGTGLGLPLTKAMVEANRATFAIHSTPGEGTLVEVVFPSPRVLAD